MIEQVICCWKYCPQADYKWQMAYSYSVDKDGNFSKEIDWLTWCKNEKYKDLLVTGWNFYEGVYCIRLYTDDIPAYLSKRWTEYISKNWLVIIEGGFFVEADTVKEACKYLENK